MSSVISRTFFYSCFALLLPTLAERAVAATTTRVSVTVGGKQANGQSPYAANLSANGRYMAFVSDASNLVSGDTNKSGDVFVTDLFTRKIERASVASNGQQGNDPSWVPSLSADGRYVAFSSDASNLVSGDTNGAADVFVYDRATKQTTRVSVASNGAQANGQSGMNNPTISADGRYVVFDSDASNLVSNDTNEVFDVFIHDRWTRQTSRISTLSNGTQANNNSGLNSAGISADGRYVVFDSDASNLTTGDTNNETDVFVYDRVANTLARVSLASDGKQGYSWSWQPSISADGRYIAFESSSSNLVSGDSNDATDIFLYDQKSKQTNRISVSSGGKQGNDESFDSRLSSDGQHVVFSSYASNLMSGDTNDTADIFVYAQSNKQVSRVSVGLSGGQGNNTSWKPTISANGRYVGFTSDADNLITGDSNNGADVFMRDRSLDSAHQADLLVSVTQKPTTLKRNALGTYRYTITNKGPFVVADVGVFFAVAGGGAVLKPSQGSCVRYATESICHLGKLFAGKSITLQVVVKAVNNPVEQSVTISGTPVDTVLANNMVVLSTVVQP